MLKISPRHVLVSSLVTCCLGVKLNVLIDALPVLSLIISDRESRSDLSSTNATENAISAVTKVCLHLENQVPLDSILPVWLSWLPVYEDKEEAPHVYSYLCKQIEKYTNCTYVPYRVHTNYRGM